MKKILLLLLLAGCADKTSEVQADVRARMRDPDSAKFRNVKAYNTGGVCGEVNAKNAMGGYVGFTPFVYTRNGTLEIMPPDHVPFGDEEKAKHEKAVRSFELYLQTECRDLPK